MKNVLVLGAGLVSRPIVDYLLALTDCRVVVAAQNAERAEEMVGDNPRGRARALEAENTADLEGLLREADLAISLFPYRLHSRVAALAVKHGVHVVTTSYVSEEMRALDGDAKQAGVVLLNEMGLDPGLDHMSALRTIERIRRTDGQVTHFSSCCGGLPSPSDNTNPWGYKLSWNPRGVLLASRNPARYLRRGSVVTIEGEDLFKHHWPYEVEGRGLFEIYPNRDVMPYREAYGLHDVENLFRGTIRNRGWCETVLAVARLGLLDTEERAWPEGTHYNAFLSSFVPEGHGPLSARLADFLGLDVDHPVILSLEWLGLLSHRPIGTTQASPLDVLADRMVKTMHYRLGERDMVILRHEFEAAWPGQRHAERIVSLLVSFGESEGNSAMARTVSLPAAISARLILENKLDIPGVHIPVYPEIYRPVLTELEETGIRFQEEEHLVLKGPFEVG